MPAGVLALAILLAGTAPADAAKRRVPQGFYGAFWGEDIREASPRLQRREWDRMAESGVESVRTVFSWSEAQPREREPISFAKTDALVELAVERRIALLPVVVGAPAWARPPGTSEGQRPRDEREYVAFVTALVGRYGPGGSFWSERPDLPRRPLREWQIWNEPDLPSHWQDDGRFGPGYGALLRASHAAVKQADPGARVVLAGLVNESWTSLEYLYKSGDIGGAFDVAAVHPYTGRPPDVLFIVRLLRRVMQDNGDGAKPIYITELAWSASESKVKAPTGIAPLQTDRRGLAVRLHRGYRALATRYRQPDVGVERAYWYAWATAYRRRWTIWDWTGLVSFDGARAREMPALDAYRRSARRDQGCAKTSAGVCR